MTRKDHPTADMVYMNIKEEFPKISLGTVYRNLALLSETRGNTKAILRRRSRPLRCMHRSTLSFCVSGMWSSHRFGDGTDR